MWQTYTILTNATWQKPSWDTNSSSPFPILCGTCKFITVFTTACHLVLSFTTLITTKPPHPILGIYSVRPISVLASNLHPSCKAFLSFRFTPQNHLYSALLLQTCYMPHPFSPSLFWSPKRYACGKIDNHEASMGSLEKRKIFCLSWELSPGTPSLQPGFLVPVQLYY
jgi:hypothetical protein